MLAPWILLKQGSTQEPAVLRCHARAATDELPVEHDEEQQGSIDHGEGKHGVAVEHERGRVQLQGARRVSKNPDDLEKTAISAKTKAKYVCQSWFQEKQNNSHSRYQP